MYLICTVVSFTEFHLIQLSISQLYRRGKPLGQLSYRTTFSIQFQVAACIKTTESDWFTSRVRSQWSVDRLVAQTVIDNNEAVFSENICFHLKLREGSMKRSNVGFFWKQLKNAFEEVFCEEFILNFGPSEPFGPFLFTIATKTPRPSPGRLRHKGMFYIGHNAINCFFDGSLFFYHNKRRWSSSQLDAFWMRTPSQSQDTDVWTEAAVSCEQFLQIASIPSLTSAAAPFMERPSL